MDDTQTIGPILHLLAGGAQGGAETYATETICALADSGLEQHVITRPYPARLAAFTASGVPFTIAPFGAWVDFKTGRYIKQIIRALQPSIIQAWMGRAASFLPQHRGVNVGWFGGYYDLKRYRNCDQFVAVTHDISRSIVARGVPEARVHTIHTFADLDQLPAVERASLTTPADVKLLLLLGRLHEKKGIDIALTALTQLPDCWLWIAGDGPLEADLKSQAATLGVADRVRFLGWRQDRGALLRAADILLVPSRYEPFGTVMVEAWGTDTPLVAAASAGPAAYVKDGENGLLVPIDDPAALADAVKKIYADDASRQRLIAGGQATYQRDFTKERVVQAYKILYNSFNK